MERFYQGCACTRVTLCQMVNAPPPTTTLENAATMMTNHDPALCRQYFYFSQRRQRIRLRARKSRATELSTAIIRAACIRIFFCINEKNNSNKSNESCSRARLLSRLDSRAHLLQNVIIRIRAEQRAKSEEYRSLSQVSAVCEALNFRYFPLQNTSSFESTTCDRPGRDAERDDERGENEDEEENPLGKWPHALSPVFAYLGCTLGLFNISRFAILSTQFGCIPLFTLQVCLGQRLAAGAVDMWKISPLFQGVGIALLLAQAFIGIYSIVGVSWMFVYFRDSFITKQDRYRWAEPYPLYRDDIRPTTSGSISNPNTSSFNIRFTDPAVSYNLLETVPDYFNGVVLQRHHLNEPDSGVVTLKFQVAFNLAVVWMIVFVSLSKGLRSYGKVVYVFTLVPVFGTLVLCTKMLGLLPTNASVSLFFPNTVWQEFFTNGRSWVAAMSEVFLTWGLLGSAAMQIAAHHKHKTLYRDTSLVIIMTFLVLLLASFLANTCSNILKYHGYVYTSSSFERISVYSFMKPYNQIFTSDYNTPERLMPHASFLVGERVTKPNADLNYESGYQVLRLATELVPATLAALGAEQVSPFWAVLFYFILILFGIAQQNSPAARENPATPPLPGTPTKTTTCYFCGEILDKRYANEHVRHCGAVLEECPAKCGAYATRVDLEEHLVRCLGNANRQQNRQNGAACNSNNNNGVVSCGSERTGGIEAIEARLRSLKQSSWQDKVVSILGLLRTAINEGEQEVKDLRNTLASSLQATNEALRKDILQELFESRKSSAALNARLGGLERCYLDLQNRSASGMQQLAAQLDALRLESAEERRQLAMERDYWRALLDDCKAHFSQERAEICKLWREQSERVHDLRLELEMRCKSNNEMVAKLEQLNERVAALEQRSQNESEATTNLLNTECKTLRLQMKQNVDFIQDIIREAIKSQPTKYYECSCQSESQFIGRLMWRIEDFEEKFQEARDANAVLYSPIFHDREFGYTLRLELYLNGLGQWKNRHVIGCLQFVEGKWDPLLEWPCSMKATVTLKDQDNSLNDVNKIVKITKSMRLKDAAVADSENPTNQRMFIAHTQLARHPGYTKNDVMYLDIRISKDNSKLSGSTIMSITIFKNTGYRELYSYRRMSKDYWYVWARQLGASIQLVPILLIPAVAIIQTCRYLNSGPPDVFDRIQLLYRPPMDVDDPNADPIQLGAANGMGNGHGNGLVASSTDLPFEDPPPKYTPPPSYTTATGARIAKMLRQSYRRSVRRITSILGDGQVAGGAVTRQRPALQQQHQPPPPDYAAVLVEMNQSVSSRDVAIHISEDRPDVANVRRSIRQPRRVPNQRNCSTMERNPSRPVDRSLGRGHYSMDRRVPMTLQQQQQQQSAESSAASTLTASEVANLLRSSVRHSHGRRLQQNHQTSPPPARGNAPPNVSIAVNEADSSAMTQRESLNVASAENLVEAAAPIGREPTVEQQDSKKTAPSSPVSVI
ncbi:unnamed protein product [Trichogramma brassicae]|uniref:MATH domain-containing protein n=1 Tax=Trichogramma brassicae TaxID=86971 RepID=A0A6H5IVZ0_9HYME|nr:unnamed protein product [Trichogramma brassicae]